MTESLLKAPEAKLARARDHLATIKKLYGEFVQTDVLKTRTDRDRHGRVRLRVEEVAELPPEVNIAIGECVYNARTALDQLAYGLNIVGSGEDPPPNRIASQFPIFSTSARYRQMLSHRPHKCMIGHFPRGTRTRIEGLQPYHRRKDPHTQRLAELAELSNIDKHRRFPTTVVSRIITVVDLWVEGHEVTDYRLTDRPFKRDATALWMDVPTLPRSIQQPDVDCDFSFYVQFDGRKAPEPVPLAAKQKGVVPALRDILDHIENRVLPEFKPFLKD